MPYSKVECSRKMSLIPSALILSEEGIKISIDATTF